MGEYFDRLLAHEEKIDEIQADLDAMSKRLETLKYQIDDNQQRKNPTESVHEQLTKEWTEVSQKIDAETRSLDFLLGGQSREFVYAKCPNCGKEGNTFAHQGVPSLQKFDYPDKVSEIGSQKFQGPVIIFCVNCGHVIGTSQTT